MADHKKAEGKSKQEEQTVKRPLKVKKKGLASKLAQKKRENGSQISVQNHENEANGEAKLSSRTTNRADRLSEKNEPKLPRRKNSKDNKTSVSNPETEDVIHVSTKERRLDKIKSKPNENGVDNQQNDRHVDSEINSKPKPKPRKTSEDTNKNSNLVLGDKTEGIVVGSGSLSDGGSVRVRNMRLKNQKSESVESLKSSPFVPKPPTTPRKNSSRRSSENSPEEVVSPVKNDHNESMPVPDRFESRIAKTQSLDDLKSNQASDTDLRQLTENYNQILNEKLDSPRSITSDGIKSPMKRPPSPRLEPLKPLKHPPPLPGDIASTSLRTSYKVDKMVPNKLFQRSDSVPLVKSDAVSQVSVSSANRLPIMTTKEARSRSLSDAGISGPSTLMGADELERYFPDRQIHVWIGSWNMKEIKNITSSMTDFLLPESCKYVQNMYVVGTQENAMNKKEWEIHLQDILGATFVLFHSVSHGSLHLAIFIHRDLTWFCSLPEEDIISTKAVTMIRTKGAVAISLSFFGTSMLFINSHLTSNQTKNQHRILDYEKIVSGLKLSKSATRSQDVTANFDCVYWCGDLNFRLESQKDTVERKVNEITERDFPNYEDLIKCDQLTKILNEGKTFQGFQEGRINFRPTYKYDVNSDHFDSSNKCRIPSYTDRILFRSKIRNHISCLDYNSVMSVTMSDHKPVYGVYQMAVKPGREFVTSAAGHFDKEVYLKANQRRAARSASSDVKNQKMSTICSIQ